MENPTLFKIIQESCNALKGEFLLVLDHQLELNLRLADSTKILNVIEACHKSYP